MRTMMMIRTMTPGRTIVVARGKGARALSGIEVSLVAF
jgi:hypothetical protein